MSLADAVKMVIWDLDDTFWDGTLAEGEISPIAANHVTVVTLAERGIVSAISSKNDFDQAAARLTDLGVWNYFVFPKIEFGPKGKNVSAIIASAGLRPQNTLFIDDNPLNLDEAKSFAPGLMTAGPDILASLLDLPQCQGGRDPQLKRLQQYKNLEVKATDRAAAALSHEDFLRQCAITIEIDYEVEAHFDRIVDLANRANQLNFTKIRLESPAAREAFHAHLASYGTTAAVIRAADKYGDYGIIGFFVLHRDGRGNRLKHFVFSCRAMNMGIEQYIYQRLKNPVITVTPPVASPLRRFVNIDWITEKSALTKNLGAVAGDKKLVLLGGCELLQLASMCSTNRAEFVNEARDGWYVRFDDPAFIMADRRKIRRDEAFDELNSWTLSDAVRFDMSLQSCDILITALVGFLSSHFYRSATGLVTRISQGAVTRWEREHPGWFKNHFQRLDTSLAQRLKYALDCLNHMAEASPTHCHRFALGVSTKKMPGAEELESVRWPASLRRLNSRPELVEAFEKLPPELRDLGARHVFNRFLAEYCGRKGNYTFVNVDAVVARDDVFDAPAESGVFLPDHLSRRAMVAIGEMISADLRNMRYEPPAKVSRPMVGEAAIV